MSSKKKILIISKAFFPENTPRAFRATELAQEFALKGHNVTVLTIHREKDQYSKLKFKDRIFLKSLGKLILPEIKISNMNKIIKIISRSIRRLLQLLFEYPDIQLMWMVKKALKKESNYDLLISIAVPYPIHWGVAWAREKNNPIAKVWVADCGDPYMGMDTDSFKKLFYFKYIEKWFMRKADYISIPFEEARNGYYDEFWDKIVIIPQGFRFPEEGELSKFYKLNKIPTFAYAGGFIPKKRDPQKLLEYLVQISDDYRFIIYSSSKTVVQLYVDKSNGRIILKDPIPRNDLLKELSTMDFLINIENDSTRAKPSKLIDYALTGRPILSFPSNFVDEQLLQQFFKGNYESQLRINNLNDYRIENVCNQFLKLLEK